MEDARKSQAARRVVPAVRPLRILLKRAYLEQGTPGPDQLVCPQRKRNRRGVMSTGGLAQRARRRWEDAGLKSIGLHECRHTAATWLDAAGVSPKVASVLMGHATPDLQPGAAPITLARYTHTLPDAMERAREQLDAFLVRPLRMRRTTARAEIHSPLQSPGILIPVVMRDCGGFDAVSKTVDGGNVVREFESLPLRSVRRARAPTGRNVDGRARDCGASPERLPGPARGAGFVSAGLPGDPLVGARSPGKRRSQRTRCMPPGLSDVAQKHNRSPSPRDDFAAPVHAAERVGLAGCCFLA
jgi:Phage integrase family